MNRQVNYIIQAFFLCLILSFGIFIINKIHSIKPDNASTQIIIDYELPLQDERLSSGSRNRKTLFIQKCAACHSIFKDGTGPALMGLRNRGPWRDNEKLYAWIKNPAAFMEKDEYTRELKKRFGSVMTAFPDISNEEIDAIVEYIGQ
ncbi:MAG: c-type cytochrome [Chitinophagaceae bacterium]